MADSFQYPSIDFCGVRVFAVRDGDRVTGHVEFPYKCNGRTRCPIDYRSQRPIPNPQSPIPNCLDRQEAALDPRARHRINLVRQWRKLCDQEPNASKTALAKQVADANHVSVRSLQQWARKLDIEGPDGLRDRYVKPPKKVLTIDANHAKDAMLVCTWWAFRIGNCERIDTKMMALASEHLVAPGYLIADLLATIDCYYSWPCDRIRYAFKPFARWARHDFPVPWLYRACDQNDYRRGLEAAKKESTPLLAPATMMSPTVVDAAMRKREVLHQPTRRAIRDLSAVSESFRTQFEHVSICQRSPRRNLKALPNPLRTRFDRRAHSGPLAATVPPDRSSSGPPPGSRPWAPTRALRRWPKLSEPSTTATA